MLAGSIVALVTPMHRSGEIDWPALDRVIQHWGVRILWLGAYTSFYVVFAMGETDPHLPRQCVLDPAKTDSLGRPQPRFVKRKHTAWERSLGAQMNRTCIRIGKSLVGKKGPWYQIYDALDYGSGGHEVGTCANEVGTNGALLDFPSVFLADGSAVPAATDRHPSLTLAANALRVADEALRIRA